MTPGFRRWARLVVVLVTATGCSDRAGDARTFIADAQEANRRADQALASGAWEAARHALVRVVERATPADLSAADERAIRQDACFRLAEIALGADQPETALSWARRGLDQGPTADLFTANLLVSQGRALERLGRKGEAVRAYAEAQQINLGLLEQALGERPEVPE